MFNQRSNLDGGTLNLDGGTLTLDGGTRPPYNLSTGYDTAFQNSKNFFSLVTKVITK